jgi:NTP pyrophosphatase (non-canonical NTP hydrolase)
MLESQEPAPGRSPMTLTELQQQIRDTFGAKDASRGTAGTFMWFIEEVGELSDALRGNRPKEHVAAEFADTLAWLATLANIAGVDLEEAFRAKYGVGCPECHRTPCTCSAAEKP